MESTYLSIIRSLKDFAEEAQVLGAYGDVLPTVKEQLQRIIEVCREESPEDVFWKVIPDLGDDYGYGQIILLTNLLERQLKERTATVPSSKCWHVTKDLELKGAYEGDVVVDPGCTFTMMGSITGNILLFGNAKLVCLGAITGDVIVDDESTIDYMGVICGSIINRTKLLPGQVALEAPIS